MIFKKLLTYCLFQLFVIAVLANHSKVKYDFIVSPDGKSKYKTLQAAINAVPDCKTTRTVIYLKKGIYKEKVVVPSSKTNLTIIGEDVNSTIITFDDYNPKVKGRDTVSTWSSYTFSVEADGFIAENITFENSAGRVGQAVAVRVNSDKVIFQNCRFLGNQDTLFAHGIGRIWFRNCYIEGTTDFIFGSAVALFDSCRIHSKANSYITAASTPMGNNFGYVFRNCKLTADSGINKVYLGRPWRAFAKTVFIDCYLGMHIRAEGWNNWNNPDKEKTTFYAEYKSVGPGANSSARVQWSKQLTDSVAKEYTIEKIFTRNSVPIPVVGSWDPLKK
jgi:pectinesterase